MSDTEEHISEREKAGLTSHIFEMNYLRGYYGQLIGATVVGIKMNLEENPYPADPLFAEVWPVIIFEKDGQEYRCELSRDEEGNGPGFMFGLNQITNSPQFMDAINKLPKSQLLRLINDLKQRVDENPWKDR